MKKNKVKKGETLELVYLFFLSLLLTSQCILFKRTWTSRFRNDWTANHNPCEWMNSAYWCLSVTGSMKERDEKEF